MKELHSPIADPQVFEFEHPAMDDMSNVTLYVPYGCREAYYESGKFNDYKEIKEDGLMKRVLETVQYYWNGVKWAFGTYSWLLYPIVLFLLVILAFIFYKLKVYQMKKRGIVSKRKAMFKAIEADIAAIIGFVPVYWCTFQIGMNHCEINYKLMCELMLVVWLFFSFFVMRLINDTIKKRIYWPFLLGVVDVLCLICIFYVAKRGDDTKHYVEQCMCLSSFFGGLSGYLCAYLAVFAGNGNILNKMKRWKLST